MAVTLNANGITFGDATNQNTAASAGGVTFGTTQYSPYGIATYGGGNTTALQVPAGAVVVGADAVRGYTGPAGQRSYVSTSMRFRYQTLS